MQRAKPRELPTKPRPRDISQCGMMLDTIDAPVRALADGAPGTNRRGTPLTEAAKAHQLSESGHAPGKLVLVP
ncbi:hypothetical protein QRX50_17120 [Amycolatopsis carbonis]|uniref:Zinc-binding dehydrogenase n=1 Tax=Amycolatopsis carbonis TaxID=715471 RepID=A0A9Y2MZ61_9PSEU|nr:zinc-binding dehydrogenase [Amycolatopsis sp. 2-15]WIX84266.1 hypothetical protein QRX50_17120 [Amycolatopsis sp. 2-15]